MQGAAPGAGVHAQGRVGWPRHYAQYCFGPGRLGCPSPALEHQPAAAPVAVVAAGILSLCRAQADYLAAGYCRHAGRGELGADQEQGAADALPLKTGSERGHRERRQDRKYG